MTGLFASGSLGKSSEEVSLEIFLPNNRQKSYAGGIKQNIGELCGDLAYPRRPGALRDPKKAHIFAKQDIIAKASIYLLRWH